MTETPNRYLIYRHIRPDKNEPFYIGIGRPGRQNEKRRNDKWKEIVQINNGVYEIEVMMENLSLQEASMKEIEFIKLYGRICTGTGILSNIDPGGIVNKNYHIPTKEEREAVAERMRNIPPPGKGRIKSAQEREAISIRMKGHKAYNYPGTMTPEGKQRHIARVTGNHYARNSKVHIGNKYSVGLMFITDGITNKFIPKSDDIPDGWRKGMAPKKYKDPTKKGRPKNNNK